MRFFKKLQLFLAPAKIETDQTKELAAIDKILSRAQGMEEVLRQVLVDINGDEVRTTGREGLTVEQVVRLGILRQRYQLSYRQLAHATSDSMSMREFLNLEPGRGLKKSAIQKNLKVVKESTWEGLNQCLCRYAQEQELEDGAVVRGDTTVVETNIHYPTDASLLNDVVRVLSRNLSSAEEILGSVVQYIDHRRRAKGKLNKINNTSSAAKRHSDYLELIRITRETVTAAEAMLPEIKNCGSVGPIEGAILDGVAEALKTYIPRAKNVVDQAYRRIVKGEKVPAAEKLVSIFEEHTDIIVKGKRETEFGHKIVLTTGKSALILSLKILKGNPKDSTLFPEMLADHKKNYGKVPKAMALDGCFASAANRDLAKTAGVSNLTFCKNLGINLKSLMDAPQLHKLLRNFRAGVEGCISFAKRMFGFLRVFDKGQESFGAALHMGAVAYNLTLLARMNLAQV